MCLFLIITHSSISNYKQINGAYRGAESWLNYRQTTHSYVNFIHSKFCFVCNFLCCSTFWRLPMNNFVNYVNFDACKSPMGSSNHVKCGLIIMQLDDALSLCKRAHTRANWISTKVAISSVEAPFTSDWAEGQKCFWIVCGLCKSQHSIKCQICKIQSTITTNKMTVCFCFSSLLPGLFCSSFAVQSLSLNLWFISSFFFFGIFVINFFISLFQFCYRLFSHSFAIYKHKMIWNWQSSAILMLQPSEILIMLPETRLIDMCAWHMRIDRASKEKEKEKTKKNRKHNFSN